MSGPAMLSKDCIRINVGGTEAVIDACIKAGCPKLIYTSSYNAIFGGQEIINGSESIPYFPTDQHTDEYSKSKGIAEKLVLDAHGTLLQNVKEELNTTHYKRLCTAALRPAAIYGEGEQRHFPRILQHIDRGIFKFRISKATVDWVHVYNLVSIELLLVTFICDWY